MKSTFDVKKTHDKKLEREISAQDVKYATKKVLKKGLGVLL